VVALLEHDHREARPRELGGRDGAAAAGADDADVGALDEVAAAPEEIDAHAEPSLAASSGPR